MASSSDHAEKCEEGFLKLQASDSKSLLKKHLTKDVLDQLKHRKTEFGSTLWDVIQSGIVNLDSGIGVYAPDTQAYTTFAELFDPIIEDYHGFKKDDFHPEHYWGNPDEFGVLDDEGQLIVSTRIRIGRSIKGFPLNPTLTKEHYLEIEKLVKETLSELTGELAGRFYSLSDLSKEVQQQLIDDHFLFKEGDRFLEAANANRFWPTGRGIFHNDAKTFLVWCNEEDHLRFISMQKGSDVKTIYWRLMNAMEQIEKKLKFSCSDRYGFLTFCPSNLGTTLRASVLVKIPSLLKEENILNDIVARNKLQVRGYRGEHSSSEGGIVDISNKRRLGLTESDAMKEMYNGIYEIITMEKVLCKT